jgi:hypothetical protein
MGTFGKARWVSEVSPWYSFMGRCKIILGNGGESPEVLQASGFRISIKNGFADDVSEGGLRKSPTPGKTEAEISNVSDSFCTWEGDGWSETKAIMSNGKEVI